MTGVVVFAPSPLVTVTVEDRGGDPDIHVHAGGQGVWEARMVASLGVPVVLCAALGGETGSLLGRLLDAEGITVRRVDADARNGGYVHDRRDGQRVAVAEAPGAPLGRHDVDALYETTLTEGIRHGLVLLSGPDNDGVLPPQVYRRLSVDLAANGCRVAADLSGDRLSAALAGGPALVKVSHEELVETGRARDDSVAALRAAMDELHAEGARVVVVSRAGEPALALVDGETLEVGLPPLEPAEPRGAGDSMTAGLVSAMARREPWSRALAVGAACGALNVVRHGLGTGGREAVTVLVEQVRLRRL